MANEALFSTKDLGALVRGYPETIRVEVEGWDRNRILGASEADLTQFLVDKYTLDPPSILKDKVYVDGEGEAKIDVSGRFEYDVNPGESALVPGAYVTIAIPFVGDADLLSFRASTFSYSPPRGRVDRDRILITFQDVKLDPQQLKHDIDGILKRLEEYLRWIKNDSDNWNSRVRTVVEQSIKGRKARLLEQSDMVAALGLPIRRRSDTPTTFSVPVIKRARPGILPAAPKDAFKPEPALPDTEYDYILNVVGHLAQAMERSPSTFSHMSEEQIRDLLIVDLNGHYEGAATGETFNAAGKTDILIRANDKNVFIAECKFWGGPKACLATIDQILGYLTWRDTKAAVIMFSKKTDFTSVLESMWETVPTHPNFKRELSKVSATQHRYVFAQRHDPARELFLSVLGFNVPRAGS